MNLQGPDTPLALARSRPLGERVGEGPSGNFRIKPGAAR